MTRLFVALPVPTEVRERLDASLAGVRDATSEHLRWNLPETWHLTLAFLGEVAAEDLAGVEPAVAAGCRDMGALEVVVGRPGRFGRGVLFLGVDDPTYAAVVALGTAVRRSLAEEGLEIDPKALHPHLTLARQRDARGRGVSRSQLDLVSQAVEGQRLAWTADEVVVFASLREPIRHEPVARIPLG